MLSYNGVISELNSLN